MKFNNSLLVTMEKDLQKNLIPMLLGEPGIGKSSFVIKLAEQMRTKCFVLACNQLADKADLTGARLVPTDDGKYKQVFYPHAVISDAIAYAEENPRETPILFMDELNRTTPDVTSECLSIPTLRSIGSQTLPNNLRVITAGNDKGNITSLDQASISRFVLYNVAPDLDTFFAVNPELNPHVKKVLQDHPAALFCKTVGLTVSGSDDDESQEVDIEEIIDEGEVMQQITTPRTITGVSNWLNSFTNQELITMLQDNTMVDGEVTTALMECLIGHTGNTEFTNFLYAEIVNNINNTNNQQNVMLQKPAHYDEMKDRSVLDTKDKLEEYVRNLSENEKSAMLAYALFEKEDNKLYIETLSKNIATSLQPVDIQAVVNLSMKGDLDEDNVAVLIATNTPVGNFMSMMTSQAPKGV